MLTVKAPAKVILTLEVLRKRPDGFHEIRSVIQTVDLCDTLHIGPGRGVSFQCDMLGWSAEKSLLGRVAGLLQGMAGRKEAAVKIEKRIPLMSGLGGDSSDAAALLLGLNEYWELKLPETKMTELAAELGSDAAFFLKGGTALAGGRGEKLTPLPPLNRMWLVLVFPDVPVAAGKTGRMYAGLKPSHFTDGGITQGVVNSLSSGKLFKESMLYNAFENIAFEDFNVQRLYVEPMLKAGALHVHLAGSGPTLFTMFEDEARAESVRNKLKAQGMPTHLAVTL